MPFVDRDKDGAITGLYHVQQSPEMTEWLEEDDPAVVAYRNPVIVRSSTIFKSDIWRRATDEEAVTIDTQLKAAPIRLQRMWTDSQTLTTADPLYPLIEQGFVAAFGPTRAAELLAPSA